MNKPAGIVVTLSNDEIRTLILAAVDKVVVAECALQQVAELDETNVHFIQASMQVGRANAHMRSLLDRLLPNHE